MKNLKLCPVRKFIENCSEYIDILEKSDLFSRIFITVSKKPVRVDDIYAHETPKFGQILSIRGSGNTCKFVGKRFEIGKTFELVVVIDNFSDEAEIRGQLDAVHVFEKVSLIKLGERLKTIIEDAENFQKYPF